MKTFKQFIKEAVPTNNTNSTSQSAGFSASADNPVAGYDKRLFSPDNDFLSQDYQTPGESGLAKWRFANIYPVMRLSLENIEKMVDASNEYIEIVNRRTEDAVKKNFTDFINKK